jgi:hypothetical protein
VSPPRFGAAALGALIALATFVAAVAAATPGATRAVGNDPRSSGEGPGLVGDPLFAIGLVVLIGVAALVVTVGWVRVTSRNGKAPDRR